MSKHKLSNPFDFSYGLEGYCRSDDVELVLWVILQSCIILNGIHETSNACNQLNTLYTSLNFFTGLDKEMAVSFEDHVFLEHLIQDDAAFPQGPVREFMELVCVGLSKNPYITVDRKHACIEWYRDYFTKKGDIVKAVIGNQ